MAGGWKISVPSHKNINFECVAAKIWRWWACSANNDETRDLGRLLTSSQRFSRDQDPWNPVENTHEILHTQRALYWKTHLTVSSMYSTGAKLSSSNFLSTLLASEVGRGRIKGWNSIWKELHISFYNDKFTIFLWIGHSFKSLSKKKLENLF